MLFLVSILGVLISIVLFIYAFKGFKANLYLAGYFFFNALWVLVFYATFVSDNILFSTIMHGHFMPFLYLSGPFAWLYVRSLITNNARLHPKDALHLIPFIILFVGMFPYYLMPFYEKYLFVKTFEQNVGFLDTNINWLVPQQINLMSRPLLTGIYFFASLIYLLRHRNELNKNSIIKEKYIKRIEVWLFALLLVSLFLSLVILFYTGIFYSMKGSSNILRDSLLTNYLLVVGISHLLLNLTLYTQPYILLGFPKKLMLPFNDKKDIQQVSVRIEPSYEADTNLFTKEYLENFKLLIQEIVNKKLFTNPDFDKTMLAHQTKIPQYHLDYYFKNVLHIKFTDWRNELRINYTKELLQTHYLEKNTLEALSQQCGFTNHVSFFTAFKKYTGLTPKEYYYKKQV